MNLRVVIYPLKWWKSTIAGDPRDREYPMVVSNPKDIPHGSPKIKFTP